MQNNTQQNFTWGIYTPYCYIIIIRGIGYRAFIVHNDFINLTKNNFILNQGKSDSKLENEFIFNSYLIIRAGHTLDIYIGLPMGVLCYITKKDRKLVLISNKKNINYLAKFITLYRKTSVYTGRGIRTKHLTSIRKAGKKDKQKGKAF